MVLLLLRGLVLVGGEFFSLLFFFFRLCLSSVFFVSVRLPVPVRLPVLRLSVFLLGFLRRDFRYFLLYSSIYRYEK